MGKGVERDSERDTTRMNIGDGSPSPPITGQEGRRERTVQNKLEDAVWRKDREKMEERGSSESAELTPMLHTTDME
jgi:hypothetical protein